MQRAPRRIPFEDSKIVAERAADELSQWLKTFPDTKDVRNVEDEPKYRDMDVDLIWVTDKRDYLIEIKADRWHRTGNFFFETHSNREKDTRGCFLYTRANYVFYYFIEPQILYVLPIPITRNWFESRMKDFEERTTTTPVADGHYTTVGRLVPIDRVLREVTGVRKIQLPAR